MRQSTFTWFPERKEMISWDVREVVLDIAERPHLLLRLELTGIFFPQRALPPFLQVGETRSRFARIDPDGLRVFGYFGEALPERGRIIFGYGQQVVVTLHEDYIHHLPEPLDRLRLPEGVRRYDAQAAPQ